MNNGTYNIRCFEADQKQYKNIGGRAERKTDSGGHLGANSEAGAPGDIDSDIVEDGLRSDQDPPPDAGGAAEDAPAQDNSGQDVIEFSENPPIKIKVDPLKPTKQQIDQHKSSGHVPYRNWCEECVRASGREDPHHSKGGDSENMVPMFVCDYAFLKSTTDENDKVTLFVLKECLTKSIFSCVCPKKGTETQVAAELFLDAMEELGLKNAKVMYKSDQEPAIKGVLDMVTKARSAPFVPEHSPVGSSQSNGAAENAVLLVKSLFRRNKLALEKRYSIKLPLNHMIIPWLVKHSAFCHNRFFVGVDGKTPYSRARGKPYDKKMVEFGERVLYVKSKNMIGPKSNQADTRAEGGIFIGIRPISSEIYVGTPEGVKKVRTIHRVLSENRWNFPLFESFRGLPWDFKAESPNELPAEAQLRPALHYDPYQEGAEAPQEPKESDIQPRKLSFFVVTLKL